MPLLEQLTGWGVIGVDLRGEGACWVKCLGGAKLDLSL